MPKRLCLLVLGVVIALTSCDLVNDRVNDSVKKISLQQGRIADSLQNVIIAQKGQYEQDPLFAAKMDTLYQSGFKLAMLFDSLQQNPGMALWQKEYRKELKFFRNYVYHHFDYSDVINNGLTAIGMGFDMQMGNNMRRVPVAMQGIFRMNIKPTIMRIILACRSQYNKAEVSEDY